MYLQGEPDFFFFFCWYSLIGFLHPSPFRIVTKTTFSANSCIRWGFVDSTTNLPWLIDQMMGAGVAMFSDGTWNSNGYLRLGYFPVLPSNAVYVGSTKQLYLVTGAGGTELYQGCMSTFPPTLSNTQTGFLVSGFYYGEAISVAAGPTGNSNILYVLGMRQVTGGTFTLALSSWLVNNTGCPQTQQGLPQTYPPPSNQITPPTVSFQQLENGTMLPLELAGTSAAEGVVDIFVD